MRPQELQKIGLSAKEAAVYLALLELGSDTVQNIAKKANVNRATTYVILDSLKKKGIVSTVDKGKKTYFSAESPETLVRLLHLRDAEMKEQERQLRELLPQLKGIYNLAENKPVVRFFEGKEGLLTIREEIFSTAQKEILNIYSMDLISSVFSSEERRRFPEIFLKKGVKIRSIYTRRGGSKTFTTPGERRYVPADRFTFESDLSIYNDRIAISSMKDTLSGVVIESVPMTNTLRSFFELAWEGAKKFQE